MLPDHHQYLMNSPHSPPLGFVHTDLLLVGILFSRFSQNSSKIWCLFVIFYPLTPLLLDYKSLLVPSVFEMVPSSKLGLFSPVAIVLKKICLHQFNFCLAGPVLYFIILTSPKIWIWSVKERSKLSGLSKRREGIVMKQKAEVSGGTGVEFKIAETHNSCVFWWILCSSHTLAFSITSHRLLHLSLLFISCSKKMCF